MSWMYRQPIGVAWSIPGAILIAPALDHLGFAEIVGASTATGLLIAVLGITGWVRKVMSLCPLPVVMGMVCGVFLPFGLKIITGFEDDPWIALAIVVAFIATSAMPALERVLPPVLAALAAGIVAVIITGHASRRHQCVLVWRIRIFYCPSFRYVCCLNWSCPPPSR